MRMLVLHEALGGEARPDELDTLVQVEEVSEALRKLGWRASVLQADLDFEATISAIEVASPSCVVNLVESLGGDSRLIHLVPLLLQAVRVPFTGSAGDAIYLSTQKPLAKRWMRLNGLLTPDWFVPAGPPADRDSTWIVKSVWEHASLGMDDDCIVTGTAAACARMEQCSERHGGEWFAERFVDGREFNISVLEEDGEPRILPIAEMTFVDFPEGKPRIVGYAAKWDEDAPEYHATRRDFPDLAATERSTLDEIVRKCWYIFGLGGYARVDIRLDERGTPWVLEVNANPCLARDAGFVAAACQAGMHYEQLIERVVEAALRHALRATRRAG